MLEVFCNYGLTFSNLTPPMNALCHLLGRQRDQDTEHNDANLADELAPAV